MPGFAGQVYDRGPSGLATLLTCEGIGAMAGAIWMTSRSSLTGLTRITLANTLLQGIGLLLFATAAHFWIASGTVMVTGFAFIVQSISNQTLIQSAIQPEMRGRVMSIYGIIAQSVPSLGTLSMGALAVHWGLRWPVAIGGVLCALLWAWSWRLRIPLAAALEVEPSAQPAAAD